MEHYRLIRSTRVAVRVMCVVALVICFISSSVVYAGDAVSISGDIVATALPAAAFVVSLKEKDHEGTWQFVKAVLISQSSVHVLKRTIDRTRPNGGRYSFPSGHTSSAFLGPGFVHLRYGFKYAWPMYVAAGYVGFTRVESDNHYETDIAAGAAISILTCLLIVRPYVPNVEVTPMISSGILGCRMTIKI